MKDTSVRYTAITAVVVAVCLEGCATIAQPREFTRRVVATNAHVEISNMTTLPVRIYLRRSSIDVALGTVLGLSSRTFEIDDTMLANASQLQLEARDRAGTVVRSDAFSFGTKRTAAWRVAYRSTEVDAR